MDNQKEKLLELAKKRDALAEKAQMIRGRFEAAKQAKEDLEKKCRDMGVDPANLESEIETRKGKLDAALDKIKSNLNEVETKLKGYEVI